MLLTFLPFFPSPPFPLPCPTPSSLADQPCPSFSPTNWWLACRPGQRDVLLLYLTTLSTRPNRALMMATAGVRWRAWNSHNLALSSFLSFSCNPFFSSPSAPLSPPLPILASSSALAMHVSQAVKRSQILESGTIFNILPTSFILVCSFATCPSPPLRRRDVFSSLTSVGLRVYGVAVIFCRVTLKNSQAQRARFGLRTVFHNEACSRSRGRSRAPTQQARDPASLASRMLSQTRKLSCTARRGEGGEREGRGLWRDDRATSLVGEERGRGGASFRTKPSRTRRVGGARPGEVGSLIPHNIRAVPRRQC